MSTQKIEGYEVITETEDQFFNVYAILMDIIEKVLIEEQLVSQYYYHHLRKGYKNTRLEPYKLRETKKQVVLSYTGAMGGRPFDVRLKK